MYTESQAESLVESQEDENNKDSQPSLRFAQEQVEQQEEEQEEQEEQQEGDNITEQGSDAAITDGSSCSSSSSSLSLSNRWTVGLTT